MNEERMESYIDAFMEYLPEMLEGHEDEYTVFGGENPLDGPLGFYPSPEKAYSAGLEEYGNTPMLVRKIDKQYLEHGRYGRPLNF